MGFSENLACVRVEDKYGYINRKGEFIIPLQFDTARDFTDGYAVVERNGQSWVVNTTGQVLELHQKK